MKWGELKKKATVKLMVDLRVINTSKAEAYAYVTPAELNAIAPVAHKAGTIFTIYHDRQPGEVELYCEVTDDAMMMDADVVIQPHFQIL